MQVRRKSALLGKKILLFSTHSEGSFLILQAFIVVVELMRFFVAQASLHIRYFGVAH